MRAPWIRALLLSTLICGVVMYLAFGRTKDWPVEPLHLAETSRLDPVAPPVLAPTAPTAAASPASVAPELPADVPPPVIQPELASRIDFLIDQLLDDDIRGNAMRAISELLKIGSVAIPGLESVLDSPDYQQRQLAAYVLRQIPGYRPSTVLLAVTVEGLREDALDAGTAIDNAADGLRFLRGYTQEAEVPLVAAMNGGDPQQAFFSAMLLAEARLTTALARTATILIEHLRDNDIRDDACCACRSLFVLGWQVLPYLQRALTKNPDRQQRRILHLIIEDIVRPPREGAERGEHWRYESIAWRRYDPCLLPNHRASSFQDRKQSEQRAAFQWQEVHYESLVQLREELGDRLVMKVDSIQPDFQILAFGVVEGNLFTRYLTLRVFRDDRAEREVVMPSGNVYWTPELANE